MINYLLVKLGLRKKNTNVDDYLNSMGIIRSKKE